MADVLNETVQIATEIMEKFKSIHVEKNLELDLDLGNLLAVDNNPVDFFQYRHKKDDYLRDLARDNVQLFINKIWELPAERYEDAVVVKLPEPKYILPREKPIPKRRPLTKWEEYMKTKGFKKREKSKLVWDETTKEWKPRWGYRRGNDDTKDWLIEVPNNEDPNVDMFAKKLDAKKERVAKNELQRLRNVARANKIKIPSVGLVPAETPTKDQVEKAITLAKKSTASLGKFQEKVPKEKESKNTGKKRTFEPSIGDFKSEKQKNMSIIDSIISKQPKLDIEKAVNKQIYDNERQRQQEKLNKPKKKGGGSRRRGGGGVKRGFKAQKHSKASGRKAKGK